MALVHTYINHMMIVEMLIHNSTIKPHHQPRHPMYWEKYDLTVWHLMSVLSFNE